MCYYFGMLPWEYAVPPVLYKYRPPERLDVLTDCRVRFSHRSAFEDDHELQPDYAIFGTESEIWRYALSIGFPLMRNGLSAAGWWWRWQRILRRKNSVLRV